MQIRSYGIATAIAVAATLAPPPAQASSHREALAILNDPCVDNTDVYAWVTPTTHDKMYLIAGFNGLHEPGQGNQQTRLCDDVLYEFHITRGIGVLDDAVKYEIRFASTKPTAVDEGDLGLPVGGGKELLIQISGVQQTYTVTKVEGAVRTVIGRNIPVAPPNIGPQTDRIAYGLGPFAGYDSGDPTSRMVGLYNNAFAATFITSLGTGGNEGRAWAGTRDDGFYLDEKGIFDIINLSGSALAAANGGVAPPGARTTPGEDVFAGFNLNVIALEIPTDRLTGTGLPPAHNGTPGDDTLLGVWVSAKRRQTKTIYSGQDDATVSGPWVQVGRQGLPLVNAGLIGTQDQAKYLRTSPRTDVDNFGNYFLKPVLVRDAEFLGIYAALGVPQATIDSLKQNRVDILQTINLDNIPSTNSHHVPIMNGTTGDVLRIDIATDSGFPNGRPLIGGASANKEQADVSDVLLTVILSGGAIPLGDGVNSNDKNYLASFPYLALPHQGVDGGHGAVAP